MNGSRIMVFYDGAYFKAGQVWFRYKDERGWFSIPELHGLFEKYVAQKAKEPLEPTKVVGAHYYDGRASVQAIEVDQLKADRGFELALIQGGVVPHYLPTRETAKQGAGPGDQDVSQNRGIDDEQRGAKQGIRDARPDEAEHARDKAHDPHEAEDREDEQGVVDHP